MEYTIIAKGKSYDLPKKTLKIAEDIEKAVIVDSSNVSIKEKFKAAYNTICGIIGKEAAGDIFGSDKLEDIDLSEITLVFEKIVDAYEKPVRDYKSEKSADSLARLPIADLEAISKAMASISK